MLRARVDLELRQLLRREAVLRQHPLDRLAEHLGRAALELLAGAAAAESTGRARGAVVLLLIELVARDADLLRVHDDDEVARVDMRRVLRLALAAPNIGKTGGAGAGRAGRS